MFATPTPGRAVLKCPFTSRSVISYIISVAYRLSFVLVFNCFGPLLLYLLYTTTHSEPTHTNPVRAASSFTLSPQLVFSKKKQICRHHPCLSSSR